MMNNSTTPFSSQHSVVADGVSSLQQVTKEAVVVDTNQNNSAKGRDQLAGAGGGESDIEGLDLNGGDFQDSNGQHHPIAEFLYQLTKMLTEDNSEIIEWADGRIKVHHPERLEGDVLIKYFRHSKVRFWMYCTFLSWQLRFIGLIVFYYFSSLRFSVN
jgi:hypothetical protein